MFNDHEILAGRVLDRHLRDDPHPHAELDVSLDHVGIDRGEADVGVQPGPFERRVDIRTACELRGVSDDRISRDVGQGNAVARRPIS